MELPIFRYPVTPAAPLAEGWHREVFAEYAASTGVQVSNVGGTWHSTPDFALRESFREFHNLAFGAVRSAMERSGRPRPVDRPRWGIQLWAMVYPKGGASALHHHERSDWSMSFTIDPGDGSAVLEFLEGTMEQPGPVIASLRPQALDLVVFPGDLLHRVSPNLGDRPRVVLSANVFFSA